VDQNRLDQVVLDVRELLLETTPLERAGVLEELTRAVYDHVKYSSPEGGGLDGADGPERRALARVVDAAAEHYGRLVEDGLEDDRS
jgi:hypothetical protein